jgi:ribosomal protein S18 acetylase RimI-like enzyme
LNTGAPASSRPFGGEADLELMRNFLSRAASVSPPQYYSHPGDVLWLLYRDPAYDPRTQVRLWEDSEGELIGFAWLEEPDGVVMQVRPDLRGHGPVEEAMLGWAAERLANSGRNPDGELWTRAISEDAKLEALLVRMGFRRDPDHALKMHQGLDAAIPEPDLPQGWTVRPVDGEKEVEKRIEIHHAVWPASHMTPEAYGNLRKAAGYMPSLDLVAAGPDSVFGAYCLCWHDPVSRTGLFEPLGTSPAHRWLGLGRAVMIEGLRRLRALGSETVLVTAFSGNRAAVGLYESVGFRTVGREHLYGKKL